MIYTTEYRRGKYTFPDSGTSIKYALIVHSELQITL